MSFDHAGAKANFYARHVDVKHIVRMYTNMFPLIFIDCRWCANKMRHVDCAMQRNYLRQAHALRIAQNRKWHSRHPKNENLMSYSSKTNIYLLHYSCSKAFLDMRLYTLTHLYIAYRPIDLKNVQLNEQHHRKSEEKHKKILFVITFIFARHAHVISKLTHK